MIIDAVLLQLIVRAGEGVEKIAATARQDVFSAARPQSPKLRSLDHLIFYGFNHPREVSCGQNCSTLFDDRSFQLRAILVGSELSEFLFAMGSTRLLEVATGLRGSVKLLERFWVALLVALAGWKH